MAKGQKPLGVFVPRDYEVVSPQEYLKISQNERGNIKSVRFVPPSLGKRGFGKFAVTYRIPVLRAQPW